MFREISVLLFLLQAYQLSEFLICIGVNPSITARIGYVIITFLPPTGHYIAKKMIRQNNGMGFPDYVISLLAGVAFAIYYLIQPDSVELIDCNPLYAVYRQGSSIPYGIFYYGIIFYALGYLIFNVMKKNVASSNKGPVYLIIGYLSFLVPMGLSVVIDPTTASALTSIMCKYAILLAVTAFFIVRTSPQISNIRE